MAEIRFDVLNGEWVIIADERAQRPHPDADEHGRTCPFCPGNEHLTPPEILRIPGPDGGWALRVVPNRYPLVHPDAVVPHTDQHGQAGSAAVGAHEVVVETPRHDGEPTVEETRRVLGVYKQRCGQLRDTGAAMTMALRNHARAAGTSLVHPHSQIVTLPFVPARLGRSVDIAGEYLAKTGTCLHREIMSREVSDGRRLVTQSPGWVAFVPFAASAAYETWLLPDIMSASIADADDDQLDQLAPMLHAVLAATRTCLENPAYNLAVVNAPTGQRGSGYCWHVRIIPRTTIAGGLELASGATVNTSSPEECAHQLRQALTRSHATT